MSKPVSVNINGAKVNIPLGASTLVWNFADGTSQEFPLPEKPDVPQPVPAADPNIITILAGTPLDTVNFNQAGKTFLLTRNTTYTITKAQKITVPGVTIRSESTATNSEPPALIDVQNMGDPFVALRANNADDLHISDLRVSGDFGTVFLRARSCDRLSVVGVQQVQNDRNRAGKPITIDVNKKKVKQTATGGIQVLDVGDIHDSVISGIPTERTYRYGVYVTSRNEAGEIIENTNVKLLHLNLGKSDTEHCLRCYGMVDSTIDDLVTDNRGSLLKQSVKLMSGRNLTVRNWTDKGDSRRLGRDVNDPPTLTLDVTIEDSMFSHSTWFRIDPGTTATLRRCKVDAVARSDVFDVDSRASLTLDDVQCTHTNQTVKIANARSRIKLTGKTSTLNGVVVK